MEASILISTKKVLGLDAGYTHFDLDVMTHINAAFAVLTDLGIGPAIGFAIDGDEDVWADLGLPMQMLSMVRSYIYLKTKNLFDPPSTSFHIEAANKQIAEFEWRLSTLRENLENA